MLYVSKYELYCVDVCGFVSLINIIIIMIFLGALRYLRFLLCVLHSLKVDFRLLTISYLSWTLQKTVLQRLDQDTKY